MIRCKSFGVCGVVLVGVMCLQVRAEVVRVVVVTLDGREVRGELISETGEEVRLRIGGIATALPRETLASVTVERRASDVYAERRLGRDDDLRGRSALAETMLEMGALDLARIEFASLVKMFPGEPALPGRLAVVEGLLKLQSSPRAERPTPKRAAETKDAPAGGAPVAPAGGVSPAREFGGVVLLTAEQVNRVRLWELDVSDRPAVRVPAEAVEELFDRYRASLPERFQGREGRRAFRRLKPYEQLGVFFDLRARDLYPLVTVVSDPPAMSAYRLRVQPVYVERFIQPKLGSGAVAGLKLVPMRGTWDIEAAYTNFVLLDGFEWEGRRMIDRAAPGDSLLLEWGLPADQALFPAPVAGLQPYFRSRDDNRYLEVRDWIASLYQPRPDYGLNDTPSAPPSPSEAPALQPPQEPAPTDDVVPSQVPLDATPTPQAPAGGAGGSAS